VHKDAGCSSELDYVEQASWVIFLKYLDDLEKDRDASAQLEGKSYEFILKPQFRWQEWAAPKGADAKIDINVALTGDDLIDFVNRELFPYLAGFRETTEDPNTIEYKIGEIFSEIKNRIQSGYNLREVVNLVDELRFRSSTEKHEMSHLYEDKIKNMGNAGRNGGEYYTPRPLIKAIVDVIGTMNMILQRTHNPDDPDDVAELSTGVDARNVRNIVLMRPVNSMIEFKQIIGRGTRLFDGKDYFTIYDFVNAHRSTRGRATSSTSYSRNTSSPAWTS